MFMISIRIFNWLKFIRNICFINFRLIIFSYYMYFLFLLVLRFFQKNLIKKLYNFLSNISQLKLIYQDFLLLNYYYDCYHNLKIMM